MLRWVQTPLEGSQLCRKLIAYPYIWVTTRHCNFVTFSTSIIILHHSNLILGMRLIARLDNFRRVHAIVRLIWQSLSLTLLWLKLLNINEKLQLTSHDPSLILPDEDTRPGWQNIMLWTVTFQFTFKPEYLLYMYVSLISHFPWLCCKTVLWYLI